MSEKHYYRIVEKRGKKFVVDLDGNLISSDTANLLTQSITETLNAKSYVYIGHRKSDGLYKVGRTIDLEKRQVELGIEFIHIIPCDFQGEYSAAKAEPLLHEVFTSLGLHVEGEWFRLHRYAIEFIENHCSTGHCAIQSCRELLEIADMLFPIFEELKQNALGYLMGRIVTGNLSRLEFSWVMMRIEDAGFQAHESKNKMMDGYCTALYDVLIGYADFLTKGSLAVPSRGRRHVPLPPPNGGASPFKRPQPLRTNGHGTDQGQG